MHTFVTQLATIFLFYTMAAVKCSKPKPPSTEQHSKASFDATLSEKQGQDQPDEGLMLNTLCNARCLAGCLNQFGVLPNQSRLPTFPINPAFNSLGSKESCSAQCDHYLSPAFYFSCMAEPSAHCEVTCRNLTLALENSVLPPQTVNTSVLELSALGETTSQLAYVSQIRWTPSVQMIGSSTIVYVVLFRVNRENSNSPWQLLETTTNTSVLFPVPDPCQAYAISVRAVSAFGAAPSAATAVTVEAIPGAVRNLKLKRMYYRLAARLIVGDIEWDPPAGWSTSKGLLRSYFVQATVTGCPEKTHKKSPWPLVQHRPSTTNANFTVPETYLGHDCQLVFEVLNVTATCGTMSDQNSQIIVPLDCNEVRILNYRCPQSSAESSHDDTTEHQQQLSHPSAASTSVSCFSNELRYEIVEASPLENTVSVNFFWPKILPHKINSDVTVLYYWFRYSKLHRQSSVLALVGSDDDAAVFTVDKDSTHILVRSLEIGTEYGIQICPVYTNDRSKPIWKDVLLQPVRIDSSDINVLCSSRVHFTLERHRADTTRTNADVFWDMPDGADALENLWIRWGTAKELDQDEAVFVGKVNTKKIDRETERMIFSNLRVGTVYAIQICAFDEGTVPLENLWTPHRVFAISTLSLVKARHEKDHVTSRLWMYTCVIAMAVLCVVSTIVAVLCQICTKRHTIDTVTASLSNLRQKHTNHHR